MNDKELNQDFLIDLEKTVKRTLVPRLLIDTVRPCTKEDFQDFANTLAENITCISLLLDVILQNEDQWVAETKNKLKEVIIIIGEQHCKSEWNTNKVIQKSKLLIPKICKIYGKENLIDIMQDDNTFLQILMCLRPKLMKDTWKTFPGAIVCYRWLLFLIEKPFLKQYVPDVLPTALIIFDDYVEQNQLLGLECINLIIEHCHNSRSLKNFNYDEVIFEALLQMAHKAETNIILPLYKCISNLLNNIQYYEDTVNIFRWTKRDDILSILLNSMELQSNRQSRYFYVLSLTNLLTHSSSGKWTKRLGRILSEYCEDDMDMKITNASINLLSTFLSIYQPLGSDFYVAMYSSLLKLRYKLISSDEKSTEIIVNVDKCITLLNKLCPSLGKEIMSSDRILSIMNLM